MHYLIRAFIISSALLLSTQAHAVACIPMPHPENPEITICAPELPPPLPLPLPTPDTTAPTVASITASTPQTNAPYTVTVVFSEDITGLTIEDFENLASDAVTFSGLVVVDARTYTVTVAGADGMHRIHVKNGSVTDTAGNELVSPEEPSYEATVFYDTTAPIVSMTNAPTHNVSSRGPIVFEFYSDDTAATYRCAFVSGDSIIGATYLPCNIPDGETVAVFAPMLSGDGIYTFAVIATDELGNERAPAVEDMTLITFTYDRSIPSITIVSPVATPSSVTTPAFTIETNEPVTLEFFGPCGSATPFSLATGQHVLTFGTLSPGTYSYRNRTIDSESGEPTSSIVFIEGDRIKGEPQESTVCYFSASDAAGNMFFHTISTFVITEAPLVVTSGGGGGNGPITVVTSTPTFTGGNPVVLESSTTQPGNGGRVIIGQNSIVPTESTVTFSSPTFVAAGGTGPTTTSTVTVTQSQPVVQQQQRRTAVRSTQRRNPRVSNKQTNPTPANQTNNTSQNQTASAAAATDGLWRYLLSFFGY